SGLGGGALLAEKVNITSQLVSLGGYRNQRIEDFDELLSDNTLIHILANGRDLFSDVLFKLFRLLKRSLARDIEIVKQSGNRTMPKMCDRLTRINKLARFLFQLHEVRVNK